MTQLGQKVKEPRVTRGMTQQRLAEKAGVSHSLMSALESGRRRYISPRDIRALSEGLEVSEGDLWKLIPGGQREQRYVSIVGPGATAGTSHGKSAAQGANRTERLARGAGGGAPTPRSGGGHRQRRASHPTPLRPSLGAGVLWTNSGFQVRAFPGELLMEVIGPPDLEGHAHVATPRPNAVLLNGQPLSPDAWGYDDGAGVLRLDYPHGPGGRAVLEIRF